MRDTLVRFISSIVVASIVVVICHSERGKASPWTDDHDDARCYIYWDDTTDKYASEMIINERRQ